MAWLQRSQVAVGEIKEKYGVTIDQKYPFQGPGAALVSFKDKNGTPCNFNVVVGNGFDIVSDGVIVYDSARVDSVNFSSGVYFDEKIYCGMTYAELKAIFGSNISEQEWFEMLECYEAYFTYKGNKVYVRWSSNPNGKSESMSCNI